MSNRLKEVLERRKLLHVEFHARSPVAPTLLATGTFPAEKFAVEHAPGACLSTMDFQWVVTSAATGCLLAGTPQSSA